MGFDGEYLWFGHCGHGQGNMIKCVEIGGEPGPYPPIEDPDYYKGLEGYGGNIYNFGVMNSNDPVVKKFDRNGNLLDYIELDRPDNYFGSWEDIAVDPDGNIWAFFDSMEFDDPNFLQKYSQDGNLLGEWETDANYGPITCAKTRGNLNIKETSLGNIKMMFSEENINEDEEDVKFRSSE
jgi:hypothetical protein